MGSVELTLFHLLNTMNSFVIFLIFSLVAEMVSSFSHQPEGAPDIQMGPPKDSPQMRISGGSDKGECASKVCKFLGEKTECGLSKIGSSGREWCRKCEEIGHRIDPISFQPIRYCIGGNWDYCDSTC